MCGIAGFMHYDFSKLVDLSVLDKMVRSIAHRGPDGEGIYGKKNIAFGHRRLSIIDLATGKQPMFSDDQSIVIVFNGEIYNYLELKNELASLGCIFKTSSDTEVIIHAYNKWGADCQKRFNGMWAFALWDGNENKLFLSRDRLGEKPLYYSEYEDTFVFGSEIKALIAYGIHAEPRLDLLELYFTLGFIPSPHTFYKNIYQLRPGQFLIVTNNTVEVNQYWDLPDIEDKDLLKNKGVVEEQFKSLFEDAIKIRMRSDVAFGAFLSGGLDSSCVVAMMNKFTEKPIETFTIGFNNSEFDERASANLVAERFQSRHHEKLITQDSLEDALTKILFHYDEPFGDPSAIPTGYVSKFASEHVKMVLTGDGGDEVLSGYTTYLGEIFANQYQQLPSFIRGVLPRFFLYVGQFFRGKIRYKINRITKTLLASNQSFPDRLFSKLAKTNKQILQELLPKGIKQITFSDFYNEVMLSCRFNDPFYKLMYFHLKVTLPDNMLTKVDRMSMAYSIETRAPFLDHRLVEFLFRVDKSLKINGYLNKVILRNTIANEMLPKEILRGPKKGFAVPLRDWFRDENIIFKINQTLLQDDSISFYNLKCLTKIVEDNKRGDEDHGSLIWLALVYRSWIRGLSSSISKQPFQQDRIPHYAGINICEP